MKLALCILVLVALGLGEKTKNVPQAKQGDVKLRTNLIRSLMEDYDNGINPDSADVKFGISLLGLDLDAEENTLNTNVWLRTKWQDSRLAWDTKVFPIDVLRVESSRVWHPDVTLYNSAEPFDYKTSCVDTNVVVYPSGEVLWVPPCQMKSPCKNNLKTHPYGEQVCTIKFGSWTYDNDIMSLGFFNNETTIDLTDYQKLNEWKVVSTSGVLNTKTYPCCSEPYSDITYNVTIRRTPEVDTLCQ